jgi:hypothetical protein
VGKKKSQARDVFSAAAATGSMYYHLAGQKCVFAFQLKPQFKNFS